MGNEDKKFKELYTNMFDGINASEKLQEKVNDIALKGKNSKKVLKLVCAVGIAATLIVISCICGYASVGSGEQYEDVIFNGKTVSARFVDVIDDDTYILGCLQDGYEYYITISGSYDKDKETLYINDIGDYAISSTEEGAELNLYEAVDSAENVTITETDGEVYLNVKSPYSSQIIGITEDIADGKKDGVVRLDGYIISYVITSDGRVVETMKNKATILDEFSQFWDILWGYKKV